MSKTILGYRMQKFKNSIHFGYNLRSIRKKHNYTQDQVVAKLGLLEISITRSTYSRYETGELNIPINVVVALKQIYHCSFDDFFIECN